MHISFKINYRFDCNEKCFTYLITYNRCLTQFLDQRITHGSLKEENTVFKVYFPGHSEFLKDKSAILIKIWDSTNPTKQQNYWIYILKTKAPLEHNVEDGQWSLVTYLSIYLSFYLEPKTNNEKNFFFINDRYLSSFQMLFQDEYIK